jgi:hypothetical protein
VAAAVQAAAVASAGATQPTGDKLAATAGTMVIYTTINKSVSNRSGHSHIDGRSSGYGCGKAETPVIVVVAEETVGQQQLRQPATMATHVIVVNNNVDLESNGGV